MQARVFAGSESRDDCKCMILMDFYISAEMAQHLHSRGAETPTQMNHLSLCIGFTSQPEFASDAISSWLMVCAGGFLIGLSAAVVLLVHGRIAGISGLVRRVFIERGRDRSRWRLSFLLGMVVFGLLSLSWTNPATTSMHPAQLSIAGLMVGYGTQLGSGCTSGHGVCGLGRASRRSLVSVLVFLGSGVVTVYLLRHLLGFIA